MASRMERYHQTTTSSLKRSDKNVELYHTIYDIPEYSNIEGVATMDKTNEVDITKLKKMLQNREEYQRGRDYRSLIQTKEPPKEAPTILSEEQEKTYDIRDILTKAKTNQPETKKHRSLENTNYNILKNLNITSKQNQPEELEDLIHTITSTSMLNKIDDKELSLDLLDDLKSDGTATISSKTAIHELLNQAKMEEMKQKAEEHSEIDKSFYTSTFGFDDTDFEQLATINHNLKKNNVLIKVLLILVGITLVAGIAILVFYLLK